MARSALALAAILVIWLLDLTVLTLAHYTPTWAVHIPGGEEEANAVAREHGFVNLGEIFDNHYHFQHHSVSKRSLTPAQEPHDRLERDGRVQWAKQQKALSRKKRDFIPIHVASPTAETETPFSPSPSSSTKRETGSRREAQQMRVKGRPRALDSKFLLNDPKWPHMWYLNRGGGLDMNVIPAWREGITGRGVVVTILDDGLESDHPDIMENYDPLASYDVNSHDSDPQPRYDMIDSNRHGTRCAGEVAASANNSLCSVGVAFGAYVGGVRMLDGDVTDAVEARSLSLNPQHVDIYSASWGPDDDGRTVDGPGEMATRAFIEGVTKGRNGRGSIFVWASGNGGKEHDNCNCDGYTNSIWTLSISSATEKGEVPWYSEMCSSTLAATYSSGAINDKQVVTTDIHHACTTGHTGTSASAPLAAGICALALQANKELTWRDMQHIVVRTARQERLSEGGDWRVNGVGRNVSHSFGYGLLDAAGMVRLARTWKTVPPQKRCELAAPKSTKTIPPKSSIVVRLDVGSCRGVNYLEHVQARVSLMAARRGDMRITLTSPAGTTVVLVAPRLRDTSRAGFYSWPFMSVHTWGESPIGIWQLEIYNEGRYMAGPLSEWEMIFYGTETPPQEEIAPESNSIDVNSHLPVAPPAWNARHDKDSTEEAKQNGIDDDMPVVWHDAQRIREETASIEAASINTGSVPSSGCSTNATQPPHQCIECTKGLHLYDGRCFSQCPAGTYASETLTERTSRRRNLTYISQGDVHVVKRQDSNTTLEALDMEKAVFKPPQTCLQCHYTCATCEGPASSQCLTCPGDAQLVNMTDSESKLYCFTHTIVSQLSNADWHYRLNIFLSIVLFIISFFLMYIITAWVLKRCGICCSGRYYGSNLTAYNKLSSDDKIQSSLEVQDEIYKALQDNTSGSESESEVDLKL